MTADRVRLPYDVLATVSSRIANEVKGVNRVVYDVGSTPPSRINWKWGGLEESLRGHPEQFKMSELDG